MKNWISYDTEGNTVYIEKYYPKNIKSSFDRSIAEEFDKESIKTKEYLKQNPIQCKRCGKEFIRKRREQRFCSDSCARKYRSIIMGFRKKGNKKFFEWLNESIDYSYSPSKF